MRTAVIMSNPNAFILPSLIAIVATDVSASKEYVAAMLLCASHPQLLRLRPPQALALAAALAPAQA